MSGKRRGQANWIPATLFPKGWGGRGLKLAPLPVPLAGEAFGQTGTRLPAKGTAEPCGVCPGVALVTGPRPVLPPHGPAGGEERAVVAKLPDRRCLPPAD